MQEQLYQVPHINRSGVWIPRTIGVKKAFDVHIEFPTSSWELRYNDGSVPLDCLQSAIGRGNIDTDTENKITECLVAMRQEETEVASVAFWSGFIIDRRYLWGEHDDNSSESPTDIAARLCRVFLRFWQQQLDTEHENVEDMRERALLAQAMLWRSYWQALDQIASEPAYLSAVQQARESFARGNDHRPEDYLLIDEDHSWLAHWVPLLPQERVRALRAWQRICLVDDRVHNRFFEDMFCIWQQRCERWQKLSEQKKQDTTHNQSQHAEKPCSFADWQEQREKEVDRVVWRQKSTNELRWPATATLDGRRRLRYLVLNWYRPRYMITEARWIEDALYQAEYPPKSIRGEWCRSFGYAVRWLSYGMGRLYAGIGIGFAAVVLQSDTWKVLCQGVQESSLGAIFAVVTFSVLLYFYLRTGIRRKVGKSACGRAWTLWWHGEMVAIVISSTLTVILPPLLLDEGQCTFTSPWYWFLLPLLLAQFALFIGIFTQLIFEEKPTTLPLDPP
jgi:hypothetical protein